MRLLWICLLFTLNCYAATWNELNENNDFTITQSFELRQNEKSQSSLTIKAGEKVRLVEILPLSGVSVVVYIFNYQNCPGPEMSTDMEIIPVQETSPMVEIGAQLERNCELNMYVEVKDMYTQSIFE